MKEACPKTKMVTRRSLGLLLVVVSVKNLDWSWVLTALQADTTLLATNLVGGGQGGGDDGVGDDGLGVGSGTIGLRNDEG
jgi:hypothetical protein